MTDIKLIVTDLDGTFLHTNHVDIPQENVEAFKRAHNQGIKVAIASGRTKVLTEYLTEQLPFIDYLITSNGACTYDMKNGKLISARLMSSTLSSNIFEILNDYELPYEIYFDGKCYMNKACYPLFNPQTVGQHIYTLLKDFIQSVPDLSQLIGNKGIEKLNILTLSADERTEIENKVVSLYPLSFASSFPKTEDRNGNLEMTDTNANKGFAVKSIAESMGITAENVMCFGDGENDCPMLEYADYSFAMANGSDYAKKSAKYSANTNDNGGVAKAINKYVFGE